MIRQEIRTQLEQEAEPDYRAFQSRLAPGVTDILGVRLPRLRQIAKQIAKKDAEEYLTQLQEAAAGELCYEEKMLFGLVIGYAPMDCERRRQWLDLFVPVIDNWAVCDSCCITYKWMRSKPEYWWEYAWNWILADTEYGIRFGLIVILGHFVDAAHIDKIFAICNEIDNDGYYVKMAQARLISECFAKFADQTFLFLQHDQMDDFTHNKAIQKICESYRVPKEWKEKLRSLRRRS